MENYKLLDFKTYNDERGCLTPLEGNKEIPFEIKRIFYLHGIKGGDKIRGQHANRYSSFVLIMLSGSAKIDIYDTKGNFETVELNSPEQGIYIKNMVYKKMYDFSENSVMLCITDKKFDADEYIDQYEEFCEEFLNEINNG